jgi:chemotaxis protein CheX
MNVDHINPFIEATTHTFQTMCGVVPVREKIMLKGDREDTSYGICGILGLSGEAVGTMVITFPEQVAIQVVSKITGEELTKLNSAVVDGVGELLNIIAGDAKNRLIQKGYKFALGLPKTVTGRNFIAAQTKANQCLVITFALPFGKFNLEVSLKKVG